MRAVPGRVPLAGGLRLPLRHDSLVAYRAVVPGPYRFSARKPRPLGRGCLQPRRLTTNLYGYVVGGKIWGMGDTKERACEDAERMIVRFYELLQLHHEGVDRMHDPLLLPTFEIIDIETAKRVANHDLSCVRTPDGWAKVVSP